MREIQLTKGYVAIVDDDDYEYLSQFRWFALETRNDRVYATRHTPRNKYTRSTIYMHREITNALRGIHVDHWNGNTLDNRKLNLRLCTHSQNMCNTPRRANNTTGYSGDRKSVV